MSKIFFREITGYCEKEAREMTYTVEYAEKFFSGNPHPQYLFQNLQCGDLYRCPHKRECSIIHSARHSNP